MIFLSDCFWHLKRKMHKDFKKILRSGISENLEKGNFHASQMSFRRICYFFFLTIPFQVIIILEH